MTRRPGRVAIAMVVALVLVTACGSGSTHGPDDDGPGSDGPLFASVVGSGLSSLDAPGQVPWSGAFGTFLLCTENGRPLTLDAVEYTYAVRPPEPAQPAVRVVEGRGTPIGTRRGEFGNFDTDPHVVPGRLEPVDEFTVARPCPTTRKGFDELFTTMRSGSEGAWIVDTTVQYHDEEGQEYELTIPWQMIVCGSH